MIKEPTKLVITYSHIITDGELRKMVKIAEHEALSIETRRGCLQMCFTRRDCSSSTFETLEDRARFWMSRGKNSGRWVNTVRCN